MASPQTNTFNFPHSPPSPPPPLPPPPPHVLPPPPTPDNNHTTIIVIVFVSFGGLFFLAFLAVVFCCFIKKMKKKKMVQETKVVDVDEHLKVKEAIVQGPHGAEAVVLSIEDDVHIEEEMRKNEIVGEGLLHAKTAEKSIIADNNAHEIKASSSSSGPDHHHHHLQHNA